VSTAIKLNDIKEYDQHMEQAVADAQKPVTASDLQSLLGTADGQKTVFSYLAVNFAKMASPTKEGQ
jgi:hypothetical protein